MATPNPTVLDRLALLPLILKLLSSTIFSLFTAPFRNPSGIGAPTVKEHIHNAFLRAVTSTMRIGTAQWLSPTFLQTYESWCQSRGRKPDIIDIPAASLPDLDGRQQNNGNVKYFWLGDKTTAKYIMVYAHGGGWIEWGQGKLAILCVCYSLSPGAVYPTAVGEIVETLRWVLSPSGGGHKAGEVLLGGDSAGGNLALAVLSHISAHPHPNSKVVKTLDLGSDELKGVLVVASWVSADEAKYPGTSSTLKNRDIIGPGCAKYWSEAYMGVGKEDEYMWAALANAEWWKNVKTEKILVLAGAEEMLVDAINDFVGNLKTGAGGEVVKYVLGKKETHAQPLQVMDEKKVIELGEQCQEGAIKIWIEQNLLGYVEEASTRSNKSSFAA